MTIEHQNSITSMVRHYEELEGAAGKSARYRARRFTADSLFPAAKPSLYIRQTRYPLIDLSASGLAFSKRADLPRFDVNSDIDLAIAYKDITLFESKAIVVREEQSAHSAKIAVHLDGSHLDIDKLQQLYQQAILVDRLKGIENTQQYIASIPSDYRALCDEVIYLMHEYREALEDCPASTSIAMLRVLKSNGTKTYAKRIEVSLRAGSGVSALH
ncbi:hypothetical protein Pse7367_3711 (plasmid) [Thalassoporum mexicanum PCC 7367]|uniref:PilZ domain-containing protein n=1 Tax=Thalassoporum mexicanum TaxID=3457544 RepID=UPI00029FDBCC|nr:PilZ domain-containing protein [Pseudanabaena sp. PCC 7367]AFY71938.1 hypothetical protein Pse7367_3711 [Pseudanabaena sp. PCC 7367]